MRPGRFAVALTVSVGVVVAPSFASAETVKITSLGSHARELCQNDQAVHRSRQGPLRARPAQR